MSHNQAFNITPKMIHLQAFRWFKQFADSSILMDTALDNIEFALGSNYDSDEWMDLAHCVMMELGRWSDVERVWMQQLGIGGPSSDLHSQPSRVSTMSGNQESSPGNQESSSETSLPSALISTSSTSPLLNDPSTWCLMMDWAEDRIGYGQLDDKMREYGSRYIHEEWKSLINEVFMLSDPGAENAVPATLVVKRAMESQGINLATTSTPAPSFGASTHTASASSQCATHRHCSPAPTGTQRKHRKVNAGIFVDIDAEEDVEGEQEEEEEEEGQEEGRLIHRPQQVGPLGKESYLQNIDSLFKRFGHDARDSVVTNRPSGRQIPTGILPPPLRNIYTVDFYSASSRTFALKYIKLRGFEATTLLWLPHQLYVEASCPLEVQQNLPPSRSQSHKEITLLPPQEGTSIMAFRAQQVLPTQCWVQIGKSMYEGDIGYVEESAESDAVMLVAPRRLPYNLPEEPGERTMFDVELARIADCNVVPILSRSGAEVGYICDGCEFMHGLLRLTLPANTLEIVELLHPNNIRFHVAAGIDPQFVEEMLNLFSAQFWRELDIVVVREGDLTGKRGALANVDWHK
ncbi:hypothetical protein F5141DRAFT_1063150 [Pisolithus sp. B1]|nr:hypothetical protein F5141DRAFT_1063150 [Pisolithus sp. B1]